jgi:hypothetical protein
LPGFDRAIKQGLRTMSNKMLPGVFAIAVTALTFHADDANAADRGVPDNSVTRHSVKRVKVRHMLPAGLPRAHYRYVTTITDAPVPYDARPFAYGRYPYAPYTNSYGIPARVIIDPVDPAAYWRPLPYAYAPGPGYAEVYATPYSCFYYGNC